METPNYLRRLLGTTLAASVFFTQTGVSVAASHIVERAQSLDWEQETVSPETPEVVETAAGGAAADKIENSGDTSGGLGVKVVEAPDLPFEEEPKKEETSPEEGEDTEEEPLPPEVSALPEESIPPEGTVLPEESLLPDETEAPAESQEPVESVLPEEDVKVTLPMVVEPPMVLLAENARAEADFKMHYYQLGYGVELEVNWEQAEEIGYMDETLSLGGKIGGRFAVETSEDKEVYGGRVYDRNIPRVQTETGGQSFCIFPSQEQLGRVPDQEFAGWYLYPKGIKTISYDDIWRAKQWQYGDMGVTSEQWMLPIEELPYDESSPRYGEELDGGEMISNTYTTYQELGDTWNGLVYYDEAFNTENASGSEHSYDYSTAGGFGDMDNPVSMVGRWVASSNSKAAAGADGASLSTTINGETTNVTLYGEPIAGKDIGDCAPVFFDAGKTEYYLRVAADVETVDLTFNSYEIFFDYHMAPEGKTSPVQISSSFAGEAVEYTTERGERFTSRMLPEWGKDSDGENDYFIPGNSIEKPAHAEWTVKEIPVHTASGENYYTDIKVEVTAPNGENKTTYVFHVQRMGEPTMAQQWGNTPVGMIERDSDDLWGGKENAPTRKQAAIDYFAENRRFNFTENGGYPRGDNNNRGALYHGVYSTAAWVGEDVDLDPTAIVVYQDSIFLDPGISVIDTEGKQVDLSQGTVKRTLELRQAPMLSADEVGNDEGTLCWYQNGSLSTEKVSETLREKDGTDAIDLRGLNVLPGVYTLEYSYTDPVSGKVYDSTGAGFATDEGRGGKDNFSRTLVVLPAPGDVDMDGAVTSADAMVLSRELGKDTAGRLTFNGKVVRDDAAAALFAYRVCDVDMDGEVNADEDKAALEALPNPQLERMVKVDDTHSSAQSDYFYIPLPTPAGEEERYERSDLKEEGETVSGAKLSMVYLGKEGGSRQEAGYTVGITGPWGGSDTEEGVELEDTFWLGVKITNAKAAEMLNKSVETFTLSLTYNSSYVEPAVVLSQADWGTNLSLEERWIGMMRQQNLTGKTAWGSASTYRFTEATGYGKDYMPHYSAAMTPLEHSAASEQIDGNNPLKTLTFSIQHNHGTDQKDPVSLQSEGDQWLFVVPFTLKKHPHGQTEMQMVELGAGMGDLTLVGPSAENYPVLAYSTQENIMGGKTQNLRKELHYTSAGAKVPLGIDKTPVYYVYNEKEMGSGSRQNGVYSTEFEAHYGWQDGKTAQLFGHLEDPDKLPPGIQYNGSKLYGVPTKAGTYDFVINKIIFRMVVDKAPLRIYAEDKSSYYGETEFRGQPSQQQGAGKRQFTFRYMTEDILSEDRSRAEASNGAISVDGDGAGLAALLGEKSIQPTFLALVGSGPAFAGESRQVYDLLTEMANRSRAGDEPVQFDTSCGSYAISCNLLPKLTNYELEYVEGHSLTILPRPFWVKRLAPTGEGGVTGKDKALFNDGATSVSNLMISLGQREKAFEVMWPELDTSGNYLGRPLTQGEGNYIGGVLLPGDSLQITYTAEYQRLPRDESGIGSFTLESGNVEEYRDIKATNLRLIGGANYKNYELVWDEPSQSIVPGEVQGLVRRRNVKLMGIPQVPPMEYDYGDILNRANELHFYIMKDGDQKEGIYNYTDTTEQELGVRVSWATPEQVANEQEGTIRYESGQTFTMALNGAKVCLAIDTADDEGNAKTVVMYSKETLVVHPRTLTLEAKPGQRFYGEETRPEDLTFTYDPNQLAACDRAGWNLQGDGKELLDIFSDSAEAVAIRGKQDYVPPTLKAVQSPTDTTPLTKETPYTGANNAIWIGGAKCGSGNYIFEYKYTDQTGASKVQPEFGASTFAILRRPIVVDAVTKSHDLAFAYADTKEITTAGLRLNMGDVTLGLPEHNEVVTRYYPIGGQADDKPRELYASYAEGAEAVLEKDKEGLYLTYTATFVSDDGKDYVNYIDFSKGYFNLGDMESKEYPVQISKLALAGEAANNYTLVFRGNATAINGLPGGTTNITGIEPERRDNKTYYVPNVGTDTASYAMGTIALRPIKNIEIVYTGKMEYTYGDTYTPDQPGSGSGDQGMRIKIEYTRENDNYLGNPYIGEVRFRVSGYDEDGKAMTSFSDRRLTICWFDPQKGETPESVFDENGNIREDHILHFQEDLSVPVHDGVQLMVVGKRGNQVGYAKSEPTRSTLQVKERTLTLTAQDFRRCYGEENPGSYGFTFNAAQLARQDRAALGVENGQQEGSRLAELAASQGFQYTAPIGSTTATAGSAVVNGGKGGYSIILSGGELTNYVLQYEPGLLQVYPRPVMIEKFESDYENKPIYTIFASTTNREFYTNVTTESSEEAPSAVMKRPNNDQYVYADGVSLRVSGDPVYGNDVLGLRIRVNFVDLKSLDGASGKPQEVRVENAELMAGDKEKNYILVEDRKGVAAISNNEAIGAVKLRSISTIEIDSPPTKLGYTYGETLDLRGLKVLLKYDVIEGETAPDPLLISYTGPEQFAQYGLYVNYYNSTVPPAESEWENIIGKYRPAEQGDHLTIAPTHDSQGTFAANGKYLIVSAQRHQDQAPSEPQIVDTPITVSPLQLKFTLSAEDKTYNGNTQAAGTLTFANPYFGDLVYPVTGADREKSWGNLNGLGDFEDYVAEHGYSFATGSYVPADPEPWGVNHPLKWEEGYAYGTDGTLTFRFLDANVAYREATGHDYYGALTTVPVQVTGIRLGGPDAKNYSIVSEVTESNAAGDTGYQDNALPRATIHKANRAKLSINLLPRVEVDIHTNAVRVVYGKPLSAVEPEAAAYQQETHYEYALQYHTADDEGDMLRPWAGKDGESLWGDERYFGGEAVSVTVPEGYVPREEDLPKEDDAGGDKTRKGQIYAWSGEDTGFELDLSAYPGAPETPWAGYDLYKTDRTALPRDTVFWPMVRVAETHNYNASPILTSVEGYTPELLQAVTEAWDDMDHAATQEERDEARSRMAQAVEAARDSWETAVSGAEEVARAETGLLAEIGESGKWPEAWPAEEAQPAVKTYLQRLDAISTEEMQGAAAGEKDEKFLVPTLEAVWFTDLLEYPKKEHMDAALRNHEPVRYRGYAWDVDRSAELKFEKDTAPLSLAEAFEVEVKRKEEGQETTETMWVNENHTARLYVDTSTSSGGGMSFVQVESVKIDGGDIQVTAGADSVTLTVTYTPENAINRVVRWSSSDESVVTVDRNGKLTFVGTGIATITATAINGVSDSITVTVMADWRELYPHGIFNFGMMDAFFELREDMLFYPEMEISRGEAAILLSYFYVPNETWTRTGPKDFPDLTGEEEYAEAARLLGSLGVFMGLGDGSFGGEEHMSRAEFIALLVRMMGIEVRDTAGGSHAFLDTGEEDTWAYSEIDAMDGQPGVLQGVGDGYFAPARKISRAETASFLSRLLRNPVYPDPKKLKVPKDVDEDYWARNDIIRAVNDTISY